MSHRYWQIGLLCLIACLLGTWGISLVDPDEVFYAGTAREMLQRGDALTPYLFGAPQFEKPPLYYWLLMGAFKLLGETPFAARLPSVLFAVACALSTYAFLRRVSTERVAYLSSIVLGCSLWWIAITKSVLTDLLFSVTIAWACYSFFLWVKTQRSLWLYWFGIFCGLSVLTKGPLGVAFPAIAAFLFLITTKRWTDLKAFILHPWSLACILVCGPWYGAMFYLYGQEFWQEFFIRDHWYRFLAAEHKSFDTLYFYPSCMLLGLLPWTLFLPFTRKFWKKEWELALWCFIWFAVVLVICQAAHSKLASYIAPLYPALAILFGMAIDEALDSKRRISEISAGLASLLIGVGAFFAPIFLSSTLPDLGQSAYTATIPLGLCFIFLSILFFRGKLLAAVKFGSMFLALGMFIPSLVFIPKLENAFTDSDLPATMETVQYGSKPIVGNKMYVRGVYFYSHNPVVVFASSAQPFWSPHPLPVISSDDEIRSYYKKQCQVLSVLSIKESSRLTKLLGDSFTLRQMSNKMGRIVSYAECKGN